MATAVALSIETAYLASASGSSQSSTTITTGSTTITTGSTTITTDSTTITTDSTTITIASTALIQKTTSLMSTLSSSSNVPTASPSSSSALSPGAIAGIVIGAIAGVALIAIGSSLISRRGMRKSRDSKQPIAAVQMGLQGNQDYRYGLEVKGELPGFGIQRHEMQNTQSQMTEMQGMDARELP